MSATCVLGLSLAPSPAALGGWRLVPGCQAGLGRGLASRPEGLGDGGGVDRVREAAEALLGALGVEAHGAGVGKGGRVLGVQPVVEGGIVGWRAVVVGGVGWEGGVEPARFSLPRRPGAQTAGEEDKHHINTCCLQCTATQPDTHPCAHTGTPPQGTRYLFSVDVFSGERCRGGGKLMYSVLAEVLGSSCRCTWSGLA